MNQPRWALGLSRTLLIVATVYITCCDNVSAGEPRQPGFNDLLVVDPKVDENGLPAAIVTMDGKVEIPPTLHIHPYYYSGDKEFQGPIINGGPTIVVARHPWSGEQLYVDVILPSGTPLIVHQKHGITYVYPEQRVFIEFGRLLKDRVCVKYESGRGIGREIQAADEHFQAKLEEHDRKSKLVRELDELTHECVDVAKGACGAVENAAAFGVSRVRLLTHYLPGMPMLRSAGEQSEELGAYEELRQARIQQLEEEVEFIPTVR